MNCVVCSRCPPASAAKQRGAVLVLALLVALVVTVLATQLYDQVDLGLRDAGNAQQQAQSRQYLLGVEQLALEAMAMDARDSSTDHLAEPWAQALPAYPVPDGQIRAGLEDAQGRFNLNTLAAKVAPNSAIAGDAGRFSVAQRRFIRLLQTLEQPLISEPEAIALTEALMDYLDPDHEPSGFGGAEADWYAAQSPALAPANRFLVDSSELTLVRGFSAELTQALQALVIALPVDTPINLNTAPLAVLQSINREDLLSPLSAVTAEQWLRERADQGFASVAAFFAGATAQGLLQSQAPAQGGQAAVISADGLAVVSDWFLVHGAVQLGGRQQRQLSLLSRDDRGQRIRWRQAVLTGVAP